jgi:hypothetical protein
MHSTPSWMGHYDLANVFLALVCRAKNKVHSMTGQSVHSNSNLTGHYLILYGVWSLFKLELLSFS